MTIPYPRIPAPDKLPNPGFLHELGGPYHTGQERARLLPVENVRAHGARGNGSADDTAAIGRAIDAATVSGFPVYFPPGDYEFAGPITIDPWDGMCIMGAGPEITKLTNTSTGSANGIVIDPSATTEDLTVRDLSIVGNASSGVGLLIGDTTYSAHIHLDRLRVRDHGSHGIHIKGATDFLTLNQITCRDNGSGAAGLRIEGSNLIATVTATGCSFGRQDPGYGVWINGAVGAANFIGSEFGFNGTGLLFTTTGGTVRRLLVLGSRFEGNTGFQADIFGGVNGVTFDGVDILDSDTTGLTNQIRVWGGSDVEIKHVRGNNMPANGALVGEFSSPNVSYGGNSVSARSGTAYERRDTGGTLHADTNHYIPEKVIAEDGFGAGNWTPASTATTLSNALEVFDEEGTSLGYVPVYSTITFDPTSISGCIGWFDANQISGLSDGDPVTQWDDDSTAVDHATQATADNQPTYQTGEINGLPVVRFDGTDDYLESALATDTKPFSAFVVAKPTASGTRAFIGPDANGGWALLRASGTNLFRFDKFGSGAIASSGSQINLNTPYILGVTYGSAGEYVLTINGVPTASGTNDQTFTATTLQIGAAAGASFFTGDIAEILVYDSALSTSNRRRVEAYLANKYAL